jgi:hypothetical protein
VELARAHPYAIITKLGAGSKLEAIIAMRLGLVRPQSDWWVTSHSIEDGRIWSDAQSYVA